MNQTLPIIIIIIPLKGTVSSFTLFFLSEVHVVICLHREGTAVGFPLRQEIPKQFQAYLSVETAGEVSLISSFSKFKIGKQLKG